MGSTEQKNIEREKRRDAILSSAIELIEIQGFETTTMDEIAEKADISKGTLYLYFRDKAALHQSIKKKALELLHEKFQKIFHENITGADVVRKMGRTYLDFILDNRIFNRAMMLYEQTNSDDIKEEDIANDCMSMENDLFMLMVRALQIGIQDESIHTSLPPKILGLHLVFEMRGILQHLTSGQDSIVTSIMEEQDMTIYDVLDQFILAQFQSSATTAK
jgi:AcrR family transcriptional regulator